MVACLNDILVPVYGLGPFYSIVLRDFSPVLCSVRDNIIPDHLCDH